jgi:hypothetical protein
MLFMTLKSRLFRELRWLRSWPAGEKRDELWNVIADLLEDLKHHECDAEKAYFVFTRHSSGFTIGPQTSTGKRFEPIAVIKIWDYPVFRSIWNKIEYSTIVQQKEALWPMVDDVLEQVYGQKK